MDLNKPPADAEGFAFAFGRGHEPLSAVAGGGQGGRHHLRRSDLGSWAAGATFFATGFWETEKEQLNTRFGAETVV